MSTVKIAFLAFSIFVPIGPSSAQSEIVCVWNDMCYIPADCHRDSLCLHFCWRSRNRMRKNRKKRRTKIDTRRMYEHTHTHVYSLFRGLWFRCSDASVLHSRRSFLTKTFSRRKNRMERCDSWCIFSNDDIITGRTQRPNGNGIDWRYFYAHARQEWHWYASSSTWLPFSFRICENNSKKASFWRNWRNEARRNDDSKAIVSCVCVHNIWH